MLRLHKNILPFLFFGIGLILMLCSWYFSYPLSVDSVNDVVSNHVSILYWVSLPLVLISIYVIGATAKNSYLKWISSVGLFLAVYSLSWFYGLLPGSDSQYFRGLNEYLIKTGNLNTLVPGHEYFQWPFFYILTKVATSVSALKLASFEFFMYAIIGFLLATALYVYGSRFYKNGGFLAVAIFSVSVFYVLNYQFVPFSLALGLLFVLFMLETRKKSLSVTLTILILFTAMSLIHSFVPLFFILYLLARCLFKGGKPYVNLFLVTSIIFSIVQITIAKFAFVEDTRWVLTLPSEYYQILGQTVAPLARTSGFDVVAQLFSRVLTIASIAICGAGIAFLLIKRKMRDIDKAILITGAAYSIVGLFLWTLGQRALVLILIPASLGVVGLFDTKFRSYLKPVFLLILLLFAFVPLHSSFSTIFQTNEAYLAENFMIDHYNWTRPSLILAYFELVPYMQAKQPSNVTFESDSSPLFPRLKDYDSIVYTIPLGESLLRYNYTAGKISQTNNFNVIYDNGFSFLYIRPQISPG